MNPPRPRCETPAITEIEALLTDDERRPLTVAGHHEFRESLAESNRKFDEIDELVAELQATEPEGNDR